MWGQRWRSGPVAFQTAVNLFPYYQNHQNHSCLDSLWQWWVWWDGIVTRWLWSLELIKCQLEFSKPELVVWTSTLEIREYFVLKMCKDNNLKLSVCHCKDLVWLRINFLFQVEVTYGELTLDFYYSLSYKDRKWNSWSSDAGETWLWSRNPEVFTPPCLDGQFHGGFRSVGSAVACIGWSRVGGSKLDLRSSYIKIVFHVNIWSFWRNLCVKNRV